MPIPIPGFGPGAHPPDTQALNLLRTRGIFPAQISCYADRADNFAQQQGKQEPPIDGDVPKYWGNVNAVRAPYILRLARDASGAYLTRPASSWRRSSYRSSDPEYVWLNYYNNYQLGVLDILKVSYPEVQIPLLEVVPIDYTEFGRISFPLDEFADPVDYPLGEVHASGAHSFPGTYIILMAKTPTGVFPCAYTVEEALAAYPVSWKPTPINTSGPVAAAPQTGVDPAVAYATMEKLAKSQAARIASASIFSSGATLADKLAALTRL